MRRLLIALISALLASAVVLPTPVAAAPGTPAITIDATTSSSITASWTATDGGNGPLTYEATIDPDDGAGAGFIAAGSSDTSTTFTGLNPNTSYTITVTATDALTDSTSNTQAASTDVAAPTVTSVTATANGSSTVDVSWVADAGGGTNSYDVSISPADAAAQNGLSGTSTSFTGLNPGVTYTVTVLADNGAGTDSDTGTATTDVAPPVITSVTATANGSTTIDASWAATAGGGTNTYDVTISPNDGGGAGALSGSTDTSTSFTGLNPSTSYTVTVVANNAGGSDSDTDSATTDAAPTVPPSNIVVTIGAVTETSVAASWTADGDPATYDVTISPNDGGGAGSLSGSAATSTTFTGLNPGIGYTVTVVATNAGGTDNGSAGATTDVAAPVVQTVTATADGSTAIDVTWTATDGGGTNAYTTAISPNQGSGGVTGSAATSTRYTGLTPGETYTITVTATNAAGSDSGNDSATTSAVAASAPQNVSAVLGGAFGNFVTVNWDAPADDGGSAITNYIVTLSNGDSITVGAGARSTNFETLGAGVTVTARVRAVTGAGNGAQSPASNSVTTSDVPGQVGNLSAEWAGSDNINAIDVSWTAPASDGGSGVTLTGYLVTVNPPLDNAIPVVDPGQTSVTIGGLEQGTSYTITVQAQNQRGNGAGRNVGPVLVPDVPGTVTNLVVEQSPPFSDSVVLTWDLPESDGGSAITGYSIVVDDRDPVVVGPDVTTTSFADLPVGDHNVSIQAITEAGFGSVVTSPNFEVKAFAPFDSEEEFVTQLYADFLRRTPDAGGLAFWTARVADDGSNVQDIVEAFMRSPEFAPRRAVARLYFAYFNRQPDKSGFDFWTRQISTGAANLENASQSFALSQEFQDTYGSLNDAEFIVLVYNNVLGRRPDQGGFVFWLDQLSNGLPRGTMMTQFSESPENIERSRASVDVTVTYDGLLQRAPDVEGFAFWSNRVNSTNTGLTELIRQFYFSPEYADRVNR